mmetsp:Transcript_13118/g.30643  ORF Transcript_13118/g.30643 Transcript_13118/m.30643 type:complete len:286 (+) Transcript_13118:79-936(+)|eukprot:CAMPEP_0178438064 /NCGR_PEP_ID=MMETSP0689_2-20121128/35365_1 /TAXON_ID=160604 /ORGANISM="Amphidinium massartii, Strain CS-259" /LENGTH=285 /DNA_ID=CAMNT_0020060385 /DNA_START=15 /DNA_END=872 /DNA_ORIENTATION=+
MAFSYTPCNTPSSNGYQSYHATNQAWSQQASQSHAVMMSQMPHETDAERRNGRPHLGKGRPHPGKAMRRKKRELKAACQQTSHQAPAAASSSSSSLAQVPGEAEAADAAAAAAATAAAAAAAAEFVESDEAAEPEDMTRSLATLKAELRSEQQSALEAVRQQHQQDLSCLKQALQESLAAMKEELLQQMRSERHRSASEEEQVVAQEDHRTGLSPESPASIRRELQNELQEIGMQLQELQLPPYTGNLVWTSIAKSVAAVKLHVGELHTTVSQLATGSAVSNMQR